MSDTTLKHPIELTDAELDQVVGGDNPHGKHDPTGNPHGLNPGGNPGGCPGNKNCTDPKGNPH